MARTMYWPPKRPSGQSVIRNWVTASEPRTVWGSVGTSRPAEGNRLGRTGVTAAVGVPNPCPTTLTLTTEPSVPISSATVPTGDAGVAAEVVVPDMIEDLAACQDTARVDQEVAKQAVLGVRQLDDVAMPADLVGVVVELEVGQRKLARLRVAAVPPKHDPDAGHQLFDAERLGDVVIAADGQSVDFVLGRVLCGQENDRHLVACAVHSLENLDPVYVRQHHVQDHKRRCELGDRGQRPAAGCRGLDVEAFVAERHGDKLGDVGLVVDDEHSGAILVHDDHADGISWEIAQRIVGISFDLTGTGHPAIRWTDPSRRTRRAASRFRTSQGTAFSLMTIAPVEAMFASTQLPATTVALRQQLSAGRPVAGSMM